MSDLKKIQNLIIISGKCIDNPSLSIKDLGIGRDKKTGKWVYLIGGGLGVAIYAGTPAVVSISSISTIGVAVGTSVTAASLSTTGVGLIAVPFVVGAGYLIYRKCKKEQQEKDRLYREIIKKQQAAINKEKQINKKLEELLQNLYNSNNQSKEEIRILKEQIKNLKELIELLEDQIKNLKRA